jgi:HSP20 family protein
MSVSQLIPWNRNRTALAPRETRDPFLTLHREMNRLFDDIWRDFDAPLLRDSGLSGDWPRVELSEGDKAFTLTAELPGMSEKDVEVLFVDQCVVLRGERRAEHEDSNADRRLSERYYGRFERRIPLGAEIEPDKAKAGFRDGVLSVTLPKTPQAQAETVRIPISQAA